MGITVNFYRKRAGRPFFKFSEKSKGVVLAIKISRSQYIVCVSYMVFQMVEITEILFNNKNL